MGDAPRPTKPWRSRMKKTTKHQFALYARQLEIQDNIVNITDKELVQRMSNVLRLQTGDTVTLFDGQQAVDIVLVSFDKKSIRGTIVSSVTVTPLKPEIQCIVPLLKRDALEEVIYAAGELGANSVQLVTTEKTQRTWGQEKELDRLQNIMIAACEQSKQFAIPRLSSPISLKQAVDKIKGRAIFFDVCGLSAYEVVSSLRTRDNEEEALCMIIGPEADLTTDEKEFIREKVTVFCALTPTVLRAKQAFVVGLGILRSMLTLCSCGVLNCD